MNYVLIPTVQTNGLLKKINTSSLKQQVYPYSIEHKKKTWCKISCSKWLYTRIYSCTHDIRRVIDATKRGYGFSSEWLYFSPNISFFSTLLPIILRPDTGNKSRMPKFLSVFVCFSQLPLYYIRVYYCCLLFGHLCAAVIIITIIITILRSITK